MFLTLVTTFFLSAPVVLQADVVNINFRSVGGRTGLAGAPDAAGAEAFWNQASTSAVTAALDSNGNSTPVGFSTDYSKSFAGRGDQERSSGHEGLFTGYLFSRADDALDDMRTGSWSGLVPGNPYDLYFYGQGDNFTDTNSGGGQNLGVRIGADVRHTSHDGVSGGDGDLVEDIEYVVFRGVVADASGTINFENFNPGTGIHATDTSFFDSDTGSVDLDGNASRFHILNGVQIVGDFTPVFNANVGSIVVDTAAGTGVVNASIDISIENPGPEPLPIAGYTFFLEIESLSGTLPPGVTFDKPAATYSGGNGAGLLLGANIDGTINLMPAVGDLGLGQIQFFDASVAPLAAESLLTVNLLIDLDFATAGEYSVSLNADGQNSISSLNSSNVFATSPGTLTLVDLTPTLLGDVNLSGVVNFLDISPFIAILSSGGYQAEADIDQNGVVNFLDISPFIAILSGS